MDDTYLKYFDSEKKSYNKFKKEVLRLKNKLPNSK